MKVEKREIKQVGDIETWILNCECCGNKIHGKIFLGNNRLFCSENCRSYFFKH